MGNGCEYPPGDIEGVPCWKKKMKGERLKRPDNWDCANRYRWVGDNEKLASKWMPETTIQWLLIAESPPCPKDEDEPPYIYRVIKESEKRPILEAIVSAFKAATGDKRVLPNKTDKLGYIRDANGAFLMDLCCYPLNRLGQETKEVSRTESEKDLKSRLLNLSQRYQRKIENVAIIGIDWRENVIRAIDATEMGHLLRNRETKIPFPTSWRRPPETRTDHERCVDLLSKFFADPEWENSRQTQESC